MQFNPSYSSSSIPKNEFSDRFSRENNRESRLQHKTTDMALDSLSKITNLSKNHILKALIQVFSKNTLHCNSFIRHKKTVLKILDYVELNGLQYFISQVKMAPDLFLKSPFTFFKFFEKGLDHSFEHFKFLINEIGLEQNTLIEEYFKQIERLLTNFHQIALKENNPVKIKSLKKNLIERALCYKELFSLDPIKKRLSFEKIIFKLNKNELKELCEENKKRILLRTPHIFDETTFSDDYQKFFNESETTFILLLNQVCQNPKAFNQNPLNFLEELRYEMDLMETVAGIAQTHPQNLNDLMNSSLLKNYKQGLQLFLNTLEPDKIELEKVLNFQENLNQPLCRVLIKIGFIILEMKRSPKLENVFYNHKIRLELFQSPSFSIIKKENSFKVYIAGAYLESGTSKKILKAIYFPNLAHPYVKGSIKARNSIIQAEAEIEILNKLAERKSPYLVSPIENHFIVQDKYGEEKLIFYQRAYKGDGRILKDKNERLIAQILGNIAEGLAEVHLEGIVHKDVKLENFLVSEETEGACALGLLNDFGSFSKIGVVNRNGTLYYRSPEEIQNSQLLAHPSMDIWALGCSALRICLSSTVSAKLKEMSQATSQEDLDFLFEIQKKSVWDSHLSEEKKKNKIAFINHISPLLRFNPWERPTAIDAARLFYKASYEIPFND